MCKGHSEDQSVDGSVYIRRLAEGMRIGLDLLRIETGDDLF
jgi:hypothetical protein